MTKPMSDSGKGSFRRNEDLNKVNEGFDRIFGPSKLEQRLKKEQEEQAMIDEEQDFEDDEEEVCTWCGGCGEGDYDGAACRHCHGTGVEPSDKVDDDYI